MKSFFQRMLTVRFWRDRVIEVVAAMTVVFLITSWLEKAELRDRAAIDPEDWFVVHEIYIPDHPARSNPPVIYDRTIKKDFRGFWVAEAQRRDREIGEENFSQCTGSGTSDYGTDDVIPDDTVTWEWFFGRPCHIPPGTYRVVVTYDMQRPGYPTKRYRAISNSFEVTQAP